MSFESNVGFAVRTRGGIRMFRSIKDKNVSGDRHGSNYIRILRLISGSIDLSFMNDLLSDGDSTVESCISSKFYRLNSNVWKNYLPDLHHN
jgi:hypothetical protein